MDYSILLGIEQIRVNTYHDLQNASPMEPLSENNPSLGDDSG